MSESKSCAVCDKALPHDNRYEINTANNCIRSLADRIAKLEAQLGAADRKSLVTTAQPVADGTGTAAAPSTYWSEQVGIIAAVSDAPVLGGRLQIGVTPEKLNELIRLHRFAAAVTRWYESDKGSDHDASDLMGIAEAFCRSENLPAVS